MGRQTIDEYGALQGLIETQHQINQSCLSCSRGAHYGNGGATCDRHRKVLDCGLNFSLMDERNVLQSDIWRRPCVHVRGIEITVFIGGVDTRVKKFWSIPQLDKDALSRFDPVLHHPQLVPHLLEGQKRDHNSHRTRKKNSQGKQCLTQAPPV